MLTSLLNAGISNVGARKFKMEQDRLREISREASFS